jgi:hypothetical protein
MPFIVIYSDDSLLKINQIKVANMKKKLVIITLVIMSILSQISFGGEDDIQKPILQRIEPLIHHLD